MIKGRKVFFWSVGSLGLLLLLACTLLVAAPLLINLDTVHQRIEARIERETGGKAAYGEMDLFFLPRPHAVIHDTKYSFSEQECRVEAITFYPRLLPLLKGEICPAQVLLSSPRVNIMPVSGIRNGKPNIPPAFYAFFEKTEGLEIRIENGYLILESSGHEPVQFSKIDVSADNEKGRLNFELTCAANLFNRLDVKGQLDPTSLKTHGTLSLKDLMLQELSDGIKLPELLSISDGTIDLEMAFDTMGFQDLNATARAFIPSFCLWRGQRNITVKGARMEGSIHLGEGFLAASLSDMTLDYPRLGLSGKFKMEKDTPIVRMHLEGKAVDVAAIRSCALAFSGDNPIVNSIFAVVKDGHVPFISVDAHGTLADLRKPDRYTIRGDIRKGRISLPNLGLDLANVKCGALIRKGILNGQRLGATIGNISGKEGVLTVALAQDAAPFHLNIQVDADLAEACPILKRLVTKGAFGKYIHHIRSIEGHATATLDLEEKESGLLVDVDCSSYHMKASYRSLPFPVIVKMGKFHHRRNQVSFRNMAGTYGLSNFCLASGLFDWQNGLRMNIESARGTVFLEQIHPLLSAGREKTPWLKNISDIKGRVSVHSLNLKGPLMNPVAWQYQTDLEVRDFSMDAAFLPSPVSASTARVKARAEGVDFKDAKINILDAALSMTGKLEGPVTALKRFQTTLSGSLGAKAIQYLYGTLGLSENFMVQTPLRVRLGKAIWEKGYGISLDGNLFFPNGPTVSMDVFAGPNALNIRKLTVADEAAKASLGLRVQEDLIDIDFSGKLQKATLDGLFVKNRFLDGWVEGDINARVLPKQSFFTSAEGILAGENIPVSGVTLPIKLEDFSLSAEGQQLLVKSAHAVVGENRLSISGNADFFPGDPRFDVDITTENVDLDRVLKALKEMDKGAKRHKGEVSRHFPLQGTAHLMWDSLKIGGYTLRPFQGEITIDPEGIRVQVENARACGIFISGLLQLMPHGIQVDVRLKAEKRNLNQCITCITHKRVIAEGTFDLNGKIQGEGNWKNPTENLSGPFVFTATNGHVKQDPALARVLSVLSITDIFKGRLPSLEKDGLFYDLIRINGEFQDRKIHIHNGLMNSPALNLVFKGDLDILHEQLDLTMVAAPFTMTDRLVRLIPVAGYILGGTLLSVPVNVNGSMKDPKVSILPASEIGTGLWGMMKRTLETPVKIMESFAGEEKAKNKENEGEF